MQAVGPLKKMKTVLASPVQYYLRVGTEELELNPWLGCNITLHFTGNIYCIQCGGKTNKSFQQGYCFPCLRRLQECNLCMIHPERCKVEKEGCPTDDWAHANCHVRHIVYLANSSALKVGITRESQVPTRWIDQGARQALPIFYAANRYQSGMIEVALKAFVADKTNWRVMLKQDAVDLNLYEQRDALLSQAATVLQTAQANFSADHIKPIDDAEITNIEYPITQYPKKITSHSLDKTPDVAGSLLGIKGQYLILDTGVFNVRKFGGYEVECVME